MPKIFYANETLFIKRYKKKEEVISFKNIYTIKIKPFSAYGGIATFVIEYRDSESYKEEIKFRGSYFSKKSKEFIENLTNANPSIKYM